MTNQLFAQCAGRLPEPPVPSAPMPKTQVVERYENGQWIQRLLVWNGREYVEAK